MSQARWLATYPGKIMAHGDTLLLVEDDERNILLIKRALAKAKGSPVVQTVSNAPEAMNYLEGAGRFRDRKHFPFPETVLLDLSLPGIDGLELLSWIRSQPSLAGLRVIALVSPESVGDAARAYQLGADSFLIKPAEFENPTCLEGTLARRGLRSAPRRYSPVPETVVT
jgi:CheY-like chemotaxis protein